APARPLTAAPQAGPYRVGPAAGGDLLIADRGNGRLLIVDPAGHVLWRFPVAGSLPPGQRFSADDAFIAPDGRTIVANEEDHQVVVRIDIATHRIVWTYGRYDRPGPGAGLLHTPDDAYPLPGGDVLVADIRDCRVVSLDPAGAIDRQLGDGRCRHDPPFELAAPNGDTPLPDGDVLVTEIRGSRVDRIGPQGQLRFDVHVPVAYPSDAQLAPNGDIVVADFSDPGAVVCVDQAGRLVWRYAPRRAPGRLAYPSLALPLPDGTILVTDDEGGRVLQVDPATGRILWQYGQAGRPGARPGQLDVPDGLDPVDPALLAAVLSPAAAAPAPTSGRPIAW
ncbi:MAG TPA: PQQ-binding-like beta-propeller repeat protein, partial [Candidatus Limnocylindrales bacterium]